MRGEVGQGTVGGVQRHVGVADLHDVRWGVGGQGRGQFRVDVVPLLDLDLDRGAGLRLELVDNGLLRGVGQRVLHEPDGQRLAVAAGSCVVAPRAAGEHECDGCYRRTGRDGALFLHLTP